jgi:hypothetical protein
MTKEEIRLKEVEDKIITVRNQKVLVASDIAKLYGVGTRDINKSVKNNPDKFPDGYIIEMTREEKNEVVENFHHLKSLKYSPQLPNAFTEKGLYMLATILKSSKATATTLAIIETFSKIRELSQVLSELTTTKNNTQQKSLIQKSGEILTFLLDDARSLTESETTIELNLALLKLKHTTKRSNNKQE